MVKRKHPSFDPKATLAQAEVNVQADDHDGAHRLLKAYRRWRLKGNAAPPGGDEKYGELVDRSGPKFTVVVAEPTSDQPARPAADAIEPLARLLLNIVHRKLEKYRGVQVDPVAALREAELALERGDLETAGKYLEDYDGFRCCGGAVPTGGNEQYKSLFARVSALKRTPW